MLLQGRARPRSEHAPLRRLTRGSARAPAAVLGGGALLVALFAAITALRVREIGLDENVYKFAAVQHVTDLPFGVLHEHISRGAARFYSLAISPIFALLAGDVAVRVARVLNCVLFAATAVPVALVARRVTASPWGAAAAGLLAVAVPWLTLATVLLSESLSYLLFGLALLAMTRALEAPSAGRELVVLVLMAMLFFTRVQFAMLAPAWLAIVGLVELRAARAAGLTRREWRAALRRTVRRFPVTVGAAGAFVALVLALALLNVLFVSYLDFAGPYEGIFDRDEIPGNFALAGLWEVVMLSLGVGLVPVALASAWLARALAGRDGDPAFRVAAMTAVVVGLLFASTLWAQGGWLAAGSEERYFIYAIPLVWIAAAAALDRRSLPVGGVAAAALALTLAVTLVDNPVDLIGEQAYLGPVSLSLAHALPIVRADLNGVVGLGPNAVQQGDVLLVLCVAVLGPALLVLRRAPRWRWLALVPAVALQLFFVGYGFAALHGGLDGVGPTVGDASFAELGWVDRASPGDPRVALLDNQTAPAREGGQRNTVFWNDELTHMYALAPAELRESGFPVGALPTTRADVAASGRLSAPSPGRLAVGAVDSPLWQVEGERVRTSPDGTLALQRVDPTPTLRWAALGLDADGHVSRRLRLHARGGTRVAIDVAIPAEGQPAVTRFRLGEVTRTFDAEDGTATTLTFDLCRAPSAVTGEAMPLAAGGLPDGRVVSAVLRAVRVEPCQR